jgi:hypothetical protein
MLHRPDNNWLETCAVARKTILNILPVRRPTRIDHDARNKVTADGRNGKQVQGPISEAVDDSSVLLAGQSRDTCRINERHGPLFGRRVGKGGAGIRRIEDGGPSIRSNSINIAVSSSVFRGKYHPACVYT